MVSPIQVYSQRCLSDVFKGWRNPDTSMGSGDNKGVGKVKEYVKRSG